MNSPILWSLAEIDILKSSYPAKIHKSRILELLPNRSWGAIVIKARKLNISRDKDMKYRHVSERHKSNGRDMSAENLQNIALRYTHKSQFLREDASAYRNARNLGILDDICTHMLNDVKFNYPQMALFEIIKILFEKHEVLYNDRKTLNGKELDVYVPILKIAFEYDGYRFHTTPEGIIKDSVKNDLCNDNGIKLYRILETNTRFPIPTIIEQLRDFGFNVNGIDYNMLIKIINAKFISIEDISKIIARYKSAKEFCKYHEPLYNYIHRNNLSHMLDGIRLRPAPFTKEVILLKIKSVTKMSQISKSMKVRIKKLNDPDINEIFYYLQK